MVHGPKSIGAAFRFEVWPTTIRHITQYFGARPEFYEQFNLPGHEGIDLSSPIGSPYYAVNSGVVIWASNQRRSGGPSAYGWHVIIDHGQGFTTLYAHADPLGLAQVGTAVQAGSIVGFSGNTGVSDGPHLHITVKEEGYQLPGWPPGYHDPYPFLAHLIE